MSGRRSSRADGSPAGTSGACGCSVSFRPRGMSPGLFPRRSVHICVLQHAMMRQDSKGQAASFRHVSSDKMRGGADGLCNHLLVHSVNITWAGSRWRRAGIEVDVPAAVVSIPVCVTSSAARDRGRTTVDARCMLPGIINKNAVVVIVLYRILRGEGSDYNSTRPIGFGSR